MGTDSNNPSPSSASAPSSASSTSPFAVIPGHKIEDSSVLTTPEKQEAENTKIITLPRYGRVKINTEKNPPSFEQAINTLTEPIENYTPEGIKEHPVLSKLGDVTRNVKELLEGGQAAGKPMGTTGSPIVAEANALSLAADAAGLSAKGEDLIRQYGPEIASHMADAGREFLANAAEEGRSMLNATHPVGRESEAGFAKIPGHRSEGPAPETNLPPQPRAQQAVEEKRMERAKAGDAEDLEKNPTSIPPGSVTHKQIVRVDPNKFIETVNPSGHIQDEATVQKYQQAIRRGEEIPPARIEYDEHGNIKGAEGRHRAEASRREGTLLPVETERVLHSGERSPEEPIYELSDNEESAAPETTPEEGEGAYHPALQAVADKYGISDDAYKTAHGASFIAPDGKFIHLGSVEHPTAIESTTGERPVEDLKAVSEKVNRSAGPEDSRVRFIADTGAIRTRARFGRGGHELAVSVPEAGVTHNQIDALKETARAILGSGKSGRIVMEIATPGGKSAVADFANANNIEPMLREIGAHPDKETPVDTTPWSDKAAKLNEQNGGFTINPRTGAVPESGHIIEVVPEARQVSDKPNTPEQIQKYADSKSVKKLLVKYPELYIGGYKNDAGMYELNLSAVSNNSAKAAQVAKNLDQESMYSAGEGKVVPTGGKNVQTKFPDYTITQRLRDLAPEEPGMTISTRQPSSIKYSTEDPMRHNLHLTEDLISKNPDLADKWAEEVRNYPGFKAPQGADTATTLNAFIEHAKNNIEHLYNSLPPEDQAKNKVWYDGAHTLTKEMADKNDMSHAQTAGIVAALSPQKDWDQNVSLARRLTDIVKNHQDTKGTPDMISKSKEILSSSRTKKNPTANAALQMFARTIQGRKFSELDNAEQAAFIRLYDEVNNPREYFKINPDGSNGGVYHNDTGLPGKVSWGSLDGIGRALRIAKDGSRDNISANLGKAHKIRHFYNNIIEPNSAYGDVTVDTHAVAAALMRALGGDNREVLANFGGPSSRIHGLEGTYALYHAAYTRAAKELDIAHPRQLQSVVWETIRTLFPAKFKTEENQSVIDGIWKEAEDGKITAEEARNRIIEFAKSRSRNNEEIQRPANQTELFGHSVLGESAGGYGRGDRGGNSLGSQAERPQAESTAKEIKPAETTQNTGTDWTKILAESDARAKAARLKKK